MSLRPLGDTTTGGECRRVIPNVHRYCDSWCERCCFQERCAAFCRRRRCEAALQEGGDALRRLFETSSDDDEPDQRQVEASVSPAERAELEAMLEQANVMPPPEEWKQLEAAVERGERLRDAHPLSLHSREYAELTLGVVPALRSMAGERADRLVLKAIEAIERHAWTIAVKTRRAVAGVVGDELGLDDEIGQDNPRSDANGSAKLVRLLIAESRDAWRLLTDAGHGVADGVPAAMIRRLDALDVRVGRRFPRAMSFIRPGFDEEPRLGLLLQREHPP
jgi:hypothetical protein